MDGEHDCIGQHERTNDAFYPPEIIDGCADDQCSDGSEHGDERHLLQLLHALENGHLTSLHGQHAHHQGKYGNVQGVVGTIKSPDTDLAAQRQANQYTQQTCQQTQGADRLHKRPQFFLRAVIEKFCHMLDGTERDTEIGGLADELNDIAEERDECQSRWAKKLRHNFVSGNGYKHRDALNATKQTSVFDDVIVSSITLLRTFCQCIWGIFCHLR